MFKLFSGSVHKGSSAGGFIHVHEGYEPKSCLCFLLRAPCVRLTLLLLLNEPHMMLITPSSPHQPPAVNILSHPGLSHVDILNPSVLVFILKSV